MLIGLTGKAGAGKDSVYDMILELEGDKMIEIERVAFADLLKKSAAAALGVEVYHLDRWKREPFYRVQVTADGVPLRDLSVREFLQRYGTEAHRDIFGSDFWTDNVNLNHHRGMIRVVTDVRMDNEARAVARSGGVMVKVNGPNEGVPDPHDTEAGVSLSRIDYLIHNIARNDDRRYLRSQVQNLLRTIRRDWRVVV